jgi:transcriptional regulator with XRE-family HTH domain
MGEVVRFPQVPAPAPEPLWRELVGDRLRHERTERGERLVDVAERAGVSTQYLSEVERGLKDPSSEMLQAITGALGLSVRQLVVRATRPAGPVCLAA